MLEDVNGKGNQEEAGRGICIHTDMSPVTAVMVTAEIYNIQRARCKLRTKIASA